MVIGTLNQTKVRTVLQEPNAGSHTKEDSEARRTTSLSYQDELAPSLAMYLAGGTAKWH